MTESFLSLSSIIIAFIALYISITSSRKDLSMQVFIAYTEKYHNVIKGFEDENWFKRFETDLPKESNELRFSILRYLHLCNEQFYLKDTGLITNKIWKIWEAEIKINLKSNLIAREWRKSSYNFKFYPEFFN